MAFPSVTVYSTPTCPYCHMAKEFFSQNKVPFKDINVASDHKSAQKMSELSGQNGVPVITIGSKVIVGFDKPAIKMALGLK